MRNSISMKGGKLYYTTDLIDWRFRNDGMVIFLGDYISMQSTEDHLELLYGCVENIDSVDGKVLVSIFDRNSSCWLGIEQLV